MAKNYPKWPKKGPKLYEMFSQMVQMSPVIPTINCPTGNGEELPKKIMKNG